jgi:hypothetical protein
MWPQVTDVPIEVGDSIGRKLTLIGQVRYLAPEEKVLHRPNSQFCPFLERKRMNSLIDGEGRQSLAALAKSL